VDCAASAGHEGKVRLGHEDESGIGH